jgi:iron(III) transport system substrate-binding protein
MRARVTLGILAAATLAVTAMTAACGGSETPSQRVVTVYVSTDRVFSEPVLRAFEKQTGVRVDAVYDTEETKSTGLANRLIAEQARPRADVFWSNEPVRTLVLKSRNVLARYRSPNAQGIPETLIDPEGYWTGFSARLRVMAYNTKLVATADAPRSLFELADEKWKGQVAMADPRFGSTSFHVAALYATLGDARMDEFFKRLKANGVRIVDGNSVVRDLVVRGEVKIGLTDTDDVNVALVDKQPIAMIPAEADGTGVPVMPNMVSLIAGGPRPEEGRRLIDYLLSPAVERQLAESEAVQIPLHPGIAGPKLLPSIASIRPMTLDFGRAAARVEEVTARLAVILGL